MLRNAGVALRAKSRDRSFQHITWLQETVVLQTVAVGRTRTDQVAGPQLVTCREIYSISCATPKIIPFVPSSCIISPLSLSVMRSCRIGDEGRRQEIRPHGQEGGRAFAYEPIRADRFQIRTEDFVAAGQVVDDRIAGDVAHRVRLCGTCRAGRPMITPSSRSQSACVVSAGRMIGSYGPVIVDGSLVNTYGVPAAIR